MRTTGRIPQVGSHGLLSGYKRSRRAASHGPMPSRLGPRAVHSVCVDPGELGVQPLRVAAHRRIRWRFRGSWCL